MYILFIQFYLYESISDKLEKELFQINLKVI